jgi:hypothetical protein
MRQTTTVSRRYFLPPFLLVSLAACVPNVTGQFEAQKVGALLEPPAARERARAAFEDACGPMPEVPVSMARAPYLQRTTVDSVDIVWTSPKDRAGDALDVVVSQPAGPVVTEAAAVAEAGQYFGNVQLHRAQVTGLEPNTVYCYTVRQNGSDAMGRIGFRTAPGPESAEPVTFVAFGDSGSGLEDQWAVRDALAARPFDLMVHTGDLAYNTGKPEEIESYFFDVYDPLLRSLPTFPAIGNHDYGTDAGGPFREAFVLPENGGAMGREKYYSFDYGPVHFVALDSMLTGPEQATWLRNDLEGNERPWTVVYFHHPPFSAGHHGGNGGPRDWFVPVFEDHHVDLVLSGHDHHYERTRPVEGVTYLITGGGGVGVRPAGKSELTAFSEPVLHFVYVKVEDDAMRVHAIDATGKEFDGVEIFANEV